MGNSSRSLALALVHARFGSRTQLDLSGFKTAFVTLHTSIVLAGELAQKNRVWFLAPTLERILR